APAAEPLPEPPHADVQRLRRPGRASVRRDGSGALEIDRGSRGAVDAKRAILGLKVVLWVAALAPLSWLLAGVFLFPEWLGANPAEVLTHVTGMTTLVLLLVTLAVTP